VDRRFGLTVTVAVVMVGIALLLLFHPWDHDEKSSFHVVSYDCKEGYEPSVAPSAPYGYRCIRE
jgi:hypothetical protein